MNFKTKASIISSVAALCLIGTGFAAWSFSNDATINANGNANITDVAVSGNLTVNHTDFYLIIDQNELCWSTEQNNTNKAITNLTLTYTGSEHDSVNEVINFSASYNNGLNTYLNITGGSFANDSMPYTGTEIINTYTLPTISWIEGMKPATKKAYDEMLAAIGSGKVSFTFDAAIAE